MDDVVRRLVWISLLVAALAAAPVARAEEPLRRDQMRNTLYCEVLTVELSPSPVATVWNSLGFHECQPAWWQSLDPQALAAEHGSDLALLNGPRDFIMDSATAKDYGAVDVFAGKRMRDVATIDLSTVGLAPPPPFTEVAITRNNTWRWGAGKQVFEVVSPAGRVYVMQSYSRQTDPALTYSQLAGLGPRVGLPEGWTYRVRRPSKKLVLFSKGRATIIQDALRNTYQRLPPGLTPG
jgi:hypothetical protein